MMTPSTVPQIFSKVLLPTIDLNAPIRSRKVTISAFRNEPVKRALQQSNELPVQLDTAEKSNVKDESATLTRVTRIDSGNTLM